MTREQIRDLVDEEAILWDDFDDAIIGTASRCGQLTLVAYSWKRCIKILVDQGMSVEEAIEYFSFNVEGAWVGDYTPIIVYEGEDE